MMAWLRDLQYAGRALRARPGFTTAAALTIAVGIGATTGVFSIVHAVLLQPLPFPDAGRIVAVGSQRQDTRSAPQGVSLEELGDWQRDARSLTAFCGWRTWGMLRTDGRERESVYGVIATPQLFEVFPMQPVLGRLFGAGDDVPGHNQVIVLSYEYWRDRFGSNPAVLGTSMVLERGPKASYTVIGVLPPQITSVPSFEGVKIFAPSSIDPDAATGRGRRNRQVFARLAPGASLADARAEMHVIASGLAARYPESNRGVDLRVVPAVEHEVGAMGDTLRTLFAAVAFVLLIACGNVAGLQLVRALGRRREFSIRQALGSSRAGVVRVLIVETGLLSVIGGAAGLLLAGWLVELALSSGPPIPRTQGLRFDAGVFAFAFAACAVAAIAAVLPAALLTTRLDLARALKEESGQIARALRARTLFVTGQVALALVLLTGAVVAAGTLVRQLTVRPGFDPAEIATIRMTVPLERTGAQVADLYARAIDEARAMPGVRAASAVSAPPLSGEGAEPVTFALDAEGTGAASHTANTFNAAAGYFAALGVPITAGRDFSPGDAKGSPAVAIVNDAFARSYLAGRDPLRTRVRLAESGTVVQIIGVAGDIRQDIRPRSAPEPEIYWPYAQRPRWATFVVVRAERTGATASAVQRRIAALDPELHPGAPSLMTDRLARSLRGPRFITLLFALFAGAAVLLSAIGVSGLVFYSFAQRTREIAVRVSLGATPRDVLRLVGAGAFRAVLAGSLVGLLGALAVGRLLDAMLRELDPVTPRALAAAWLLLIALGWLACYLPARRALALDPADTLRAE